MNVGLVTLRRLAVLVVILHALVTAPHSIAHTNLHIAMDTWQNIYIFVVILIAPIVAAVFIWIRRRSGFALLTISMIGSFVFGVYYHFIATGSDNAFTLPASSWTLTFQLTAWLLAITELAGAVIGFLGLANRLVQTPG
jgi:presenilin-like A22 family membrane protease